VSRFLAAAAAAYLAGACPAAPAPKAAGPTYIDLQGRANQPLADDAGGRFPNNTLAPVPTGE